MEPQHSGTTSGTETPPPEPPPYAPVTPASVTSLLTTPPPELPSLIDRWELSPSADVLEPSTSELLGDHAARRYRQFRHFVESRQVENLDNMLFSMLLSGEGLCDEIRSFEGASPLVRLAQTGYLVRKLRQLQELLDAVALTFAMNEPEHLASWETALEIERTQRIERFQLLLKVRLGDDEKGADVELYGDDLDCWNLTDGTLVEEILTMLTAGVDNYANDILTKQETKTIQIAFDAVTRCSNVMVLTIPKWFVSPFEFGGTYGLGRWGNDLLYPDHNDRERFITEASIWSGLNHPHIAKFLGACHVGSRPFFAHEKVRTLTEYLGAVKVTDRQAVWSRLYELSLGVRYLHERGFGCGQLGLENVYCARFEDKTLLLGVGLVKSETELTAAGIESGLRTNSLAKLVRADIRSLFFFVLDALAVLVSSQKDEINKKDKDAKATNADSDRTLPTSRPGFVTADEWSVLQPMFKDKSDVNMLVALDCFGSLARNKERDAFDDMASIANQLDKQVIDLGEIRVLSNGMSLREVLEQCERLAGREPSCAQIHARLSNVLDELHRYDLCGKDINEAKEMVGHVCSLIVRFYRFLYQKSTSVASSQAGWNRREPAALFSFHTGIDHWINQYCMSITDTIHDWQLAWQQLQSSRQSLRVQLQSVVEQLSDDGEEETYCEFERMHLHTAYSMETQSSVGSSHIGSHDPHVDAQKQFSLPKWLIPPYEVNFREFDAFAEGAFGAVHRGKWFETPVIVKRVLTSGKTVQQQFRREADIWFGLNHINVIKMYGACHVGQPFFVCEYASGGELMQFLEREGRNPYLIWYCLLNAALGLQYLHEAGVVHGDLKANNILMGNDGIVKLADFGLSLSTKARAQISEPGGAVGAFRWKAPECIPSKDDPGQSPTFASDVYSFAMCIIEIVSGDYPWGKLEDAAVKFHVKRRHQLPSRVPAMGDSEWQLIERMCCFDPIKRVTIGAVVVHLSALIERLDMEQLWPSIGGKIPFKSYNNRVISRDGALLSLLKLATSTNSRVANLAGDRVLAVHINRGTQSGSHELELIVKMLKNENVNIKNWATRAIDCLCWCNDVNTVSIAKFGAIPVLVALTRNGNEIQRENAAAALWGLSANDDNQVSIAAANGIPALVTLIRDGNEIQKEKAAAALWNLALNADNQVSIAAVGAIPALVTLIRDGNEIQKEKAAGALWNLSANVDNQVSIAAAGAIPALVTLIRDGNEIQRENAAGALWNLSANDDNKVSIAAAGAIPALATLIRDGNEIQRENAAGALWNLSANDDNQVSIAAAGAIPALMTLIRDGNEIQKEKAAAALWNLSANDDNQVSIAAANGIPALVTLIRDGNEIQKENAAAALWNLALNADNQVSIAAAGAIPALVTLIRDGNEIQKEKAAAALWNLAVNADNQVSIAAAGAIPALVTLIRDGNEIQRENAAGALWNLAVNADNQVSIAAVGAIPALVTLIRDGNEIQKENAATALWNLAVNADNQVSIAAAGAIPALVTLIRDGNEIQKENAAGALWNLSNNANTTDIAAAGAIPLVIALVRDGNDEQKECAAGVLWNLAYFNETLRPSIVAQCAVTPLLHAVMTCTGRSRKMAAGALAFLDVDENVKAAVIAHGGIAALLEELEYPNSNDEVLVALTKLCAGNGANVRSIVEEANGVSILSALATDKDDRLRELSTRILSELELAHTS